MVRPARLRGAQVRVVSLLQWGTPGLGETSSFHPHRVIISHQEVVAKHTGSGGGTPGFEPRIGRWAGSMLRDAVFLVLFKEATTMPVSQAP